MFDRHLHVSKKTILIGLKAGLLAGLFGAIELMVDPHTTITYALAMLGVFIASIVETVTINTPQIYRLRCSLILSIFSLVTFSIGSLCAGKYGPTMFFLILFMAIVALANPSNIFISSIILFSGDLFVIGNGVSGHSLTECFIHGSALFLGSVSMFASEYLLVYPFVKKGVYTDKFPLGKILLINQQTLNYAFNYIFAISLAYNLSYFLKLPQGFWVPMTALLVMKQCHDFSWQRIKHRLGGSAIGFLFALVIGAYLNNRFLLLILIVAFYFLIVLSLAKHYGAYTFFLTLMITDLYMLIDYNGVLVSKHRLINTVLGALVVIFVLSINKIWRIRKRLFLKLYRVVI